MEPGCSTKTMVYNHQTTKRSSSKDHAANSENNKHSLLLSTAPEIIVKALLNFPKVSSNNST